jgi:signal peptidase
MGAVVAAGKRGGSDSQLRVAAAVRALRDRTSATLRSIRRPVNAGFLVVLAAVVGLWWTNLRPVALGGPASYLIVHGDSMNPVLASGDLVLARVQPSYGVGELVIYSVPRGQIGAGDTVIHRIVGGTASAGYTLKGDNNPAPDPWAVPRSDILGEATTVIPGVGNLLVLIHTPLFAGAAAAVIAASIVLSPPGWMRRRPVPALGLPAVVAAPAAAAVPPVATRRPPTRRPARTKPASALSESPAPRTTRPAARRTAQTRGAVPTPVAPPRARRRPVTPAETPAQPPAARRPPRPRRSRRDQAPVRPTER